jgi:quercetin dioxygenase-like cupin family protein
MSAQRSLVNRDGRGLEILLSSTATGGTLSVVDCQVPAGSVGPPLHVHPESDETFLVLSGTLLLHLDDRLVELHTGAVAHVTRGSRHTFATNPDEPAHFLTLHTPGGFERFHADAAVAEYTRGGPLSTTELAQLAEAYDWQIAGPPLLPTGKLLTAGS